MRELTALREELGREKARVFALEQELETREQRLRELSIELEEQKAVAPPALPKPPPLPVPALLELDSALQQPSEPFASLMPDAAPLIASNDVDGDPFPSLQQISLRPERGHRAHDEGAPSSRAAERLQCEFELTFVEDTHFFSGLTQDISTGGLFVATYNLLPIGTPLELSFQLPSGEHVEVSGIVRWVREEALGDARPGLGVAFTELSAEALRGITEFCALRPPLFMEL